MLARLTRQAETITEWQAAQARYRSATEERSKLLAELRSLELAASLANNPSDAQSPRTDAARRDAAEYLALAKRRPETVAEKIRDLTYMIEDGAAAYRNEVDLYHAAMRAESNRVAAELAPAHRDTVRRVAKAIEELSRATAAERNVRAEFSRRAPEQVSARLPPLDGCWGTLGEWGSILSAWARTARKLGYLD
jgi:hypothetical protein